MQIRIHSGVELIDAKTLRARLDEIISPQLSRFGVVWRGDNTGAEAGDVSTRRVIRLVRLKGFGSVVWWGYSLGFTPHISGTRLVYHRSFKSARFDLFEWPEDYARSFSTRTAFDEVILVAGTFETSLRSYFNSKIHELAGWFERVHDLDGIELELRRQASSPDWRYRVHHPSPGYVLPFVVAALGNIPEAERLAETGFAEALGPLVPKLKQSLRRAGPRRWSAATDHD